MEPRPQPARYAVLFRVPPEPAVAGALAIDDDRLLLDGGTARAPVELSIPFTELIEVRIGRGRQERLNEHPSLVLTRADGEPVQVEPYGAGLLHELADLLTHLAAKRVDEDEQVAVVVPLRKGGLARARQLVAQGPPFNPAGLGFTGHHVYLNPDEAIFVFSGPHVRATLEKASRNPILWQIGLDWEKCMSGPPRLTTTFFAHQAGGDEPAYSWTSGRKEGS